MTDPVGDAIVAIVHGDPAGLPLVFAAGLLTGFGPCTAPRYLALAPMLRGRGRTRTIGIFVIGMLVTYAAIAFGLGVVVDVTRAASAVYLIFSAALVILGLRTLLRSGDCAHAHAGGHVRTSGAFSLGAASALGVSPCCTPVLIAVSGAAAADGDAGSRLILLAAFVLGHAAPLFAAAPLTAALARGANRWKLDPAPAVVAGALTIALGAYYGLLA
jgi:cytochrome c biogenesis protein CcdA